MRGKFARLWILLLPICLAAHLPTARGQANGNPNYQGGVQVAGKPVYPYTHAYLVSLNDSIQYPCGFNGTPTAQWGYSFFALSTGGDVDATCYQQPFAITADIFSPVAKPILIWLPDVAITVNANVTIPSNFELCYGPGSSIAAGAGYTLTNNATPCLSGGPTPPTGNVNWYVNNILIGTEPGGNFDNGANTTWSGVDDPTNHRVDITVNAAGGTSGCSAGTVEGGYVCAGPPLLGALAPPILDQQLGYGFSSTSVAVTLPQAIASGQQLLVPLLTSGLQTCSASMFSDSLGDTYSILYSGTAGGAQCIALATAASSGAVTVTVSGLNSGNYQAVGVFKTYNIGAFDAQANFLGGVGVQTGTATVTTTHAGDLLLGVASNQDGTLQLYQNSSNWANFGTSPVQSGGSEALQWGWSGSYLPAAGSQSLTWSSSAASGPFSGQNVWVFSFSPAAAWPTSGPPSFRLLYGPDIPSTLWLTSVDYDPLPFLYIPACSAGPPPIGTEGFLRFITDSTTNVQGAAITVGGGTDAVFAGCDGTAWKVMSGPGGGSMVYPGAGVANSTGSAWGTSYGVGTAANDLVQLNSSGFLPALNGSLLTNLPLPSASQINTLIQTLTGCSTAGYVYSPAGSDCVAPGGGSGGFSAMTTYGDAYATSATTGTSDTPAATIGKFVPMHVNNTAAATAPQAVQIGLTAREVTGSTDTILASDCAAGRINYKTSASIAVALGTPSSLSNTGCIFVAASTFDGTNTPPAMTFTAGGSYNFSVDGGALSSTFTVASGRYAIVSVDNTNPSQWDVDYPVVNGTRACVIDNDTQSSTPLVAANFSGRCNIPKASTIVEVDVIGGTGVVTGTATAPTVTGTSSVQIGIYRPSGSSPTTGILSAVLATASGKACALPTAGSATCGIMGITQAGSSLSISTTSLNAGDVLYVSAANPDAAQTWYTVTIYYQ